ncbi:NERD domain protein [Calothrix sp. NIES-4071]|nr:NERD domain protein [Calothrix sp. NIES-4071]BAZ59902.1 NERD domain protein [Calothrix sp. NIES-4105]
MAKMFPEHLRSNIRSRAEKLLYKAFQEQLSDSFVVFHSCRWQVRNLRNGAKDGEADFIIACPNLGILVVEVKGGQIRYDGRENQYYSNDNHISNPFEQACDSKYALLSRLKELSYWKNRWVPIGHAVAFPDVEVNGSLTLDAPRALILDYTQLNNLSGWVEAVFNYWHGQIQRNLNRNNFDTNSVKQLIKVIAPISPRILPRHDDDVFKNLTDQQMDILDFLATHRRVAISGCAGSGKTLLALEKARRLNEQGFTVLVTCFNRSLAQFMRQSSNRNPNLHIYNFHGLCKKLFEQAALAPNENNISEDKLFKEIYPNLLIDAADKLRWHVDAVIVDEGQDFYEDWWLALKCLLHNPDNGIFYFFYDDNQNIYDSNWKPPLDEAPFSLNKNCRNTQKIHEYVLKFHPEPNSTASLCPLGQDVEFHNYKGDAQLKKILGQVLHRLVIDEGFATKDIVILTTTRKQSLQNQVVGQFRIKAEPDISRKEILCNTIHHFKGLESKVVILVETESKTPNHQQLLYVGASRARHHLIIVQP